MKKITFLVLFSTPLFYTSCDNNNGYLTKVYGIVRDAGIGTPIPDAAVFLYKNKNDFYGAADAGYPIDTIYSDENGYYEYEFIDEPGYLYAIGLQKDGYWEENPTSDFIEGKETKLDLHIYPYAWLKIHVKNVNPFNQQDRIGLSLFCQSGYPEFLGTSVDTSIVCEVKGNKDLNLVWWVKKDNQDNNYHDTINCEGHQTTVYELFY